MKKGGKGWKLGEFDDRNVPRNGTVVHLTFYPTITDSGTTWNPDWYRADEECRWDHAEKIDGI